VSGEALAEDAEDVAVPAAAAAQTGAWTEGGTAGITFDSGDQTIQEFGSALMEMMVWHSSELF
jgi:hypothetical protein